MPSRPRVLISDSLSPKAVERFAYRGINADYRPELGSDKAALHAAIADYDGLCVRSTTKFSAKLAGAAMKLKVIGRAGIGVDNIDLAAATQRGMVVMNTPHGNAVTTAEHTIAMLFACARQIAAADRSTQDGKWEKSRFVGIELLSKTLGIIGCGNIGAIVAELAIGLKMKVIAFDPYLTAERAAEIGVEKTSKEALFARADFISLHTPLTDETRNIIDAAALQQMKPGVRIINCARGGLIDEPALREGLDSGKVAAAAIDVFTQEPARENVLFGAANLVCTPHLGAATNDAQENVALQVADQMADYLLEGAVVNALNMPAISAEEAPAIMPFLRLGEQLGSFAGQLTDTEISNITIELAGGVSKMNAPAINAAVLTGLLAPSAQSVNMVSAPEIAKRRGIKVGNELSEESGVFDNYILITITTDAFVRSVGGTVFSDERPRIIQIKGINMEATLGDHMLYVVNNDQPGFIGDFGTALARRNINIATLNLGRTARGGEAICLAEIDEPCPPDALQEIAELPSVTRIKFLKFD